MGVIAKCVLQVSSFSVSVLDSGPQTNDVMFSLIHTNAQSLYETPDWIEWMWKWNISLHHLDTWRNHDTGADIQNLTGSWEEMESGEEVNGEDTDLLEDHLPDRKRRLTSFRAKQITFNPNDVIDEQGICR